MQEYENILVIAAHPDDEVLGCGGTISKLTSSGKKVYVAILGEGASSRFSKREDADQLLLTDLIGQSKAVANLLGVEEIFTYGLPDNRFDTVPLLEIAKLIEGLIDKVKPEVIFTQHGGDLNIDHALLFRATLTAARPMLNSSVRQIYAYEVASSTEWSFQQFEPRFCPNFYVDISDTLDVKLQAMKIYENEMREFPHPRSLENIRNCARRWGSVVGKNAAEAFQLVWGVA